MIRRIAGATALALLAALPHATGPQAAQAGLPLFGFPKKSKPPVVLLAEMIDDLEESLNDTGTIVAKKPDVWGESRLTKHRQEVEEKLAAEIDNFQLLLNASSAVSDQAFLANALAISAALGSNNTIPGQVVGSPGGTSQSLNIYSVDSEISSLTPNATVGSDGKMAEGAVIGRTDPSSFSLTTAMLGHVNNDEEVGGFFADRKLSLEPTLRLDQLKRYLDHLNELRRLNEGGDTADAPGYSLNLVRIPVSVMPGDDTRKGHGAEITVTAEMHLTRELLPTTFRSMVIEDLVDQLALPLVKIVESHAWEMRRDEQLVEEIQKTRAIWQVARAQIKTAVQLLSFDKNETEGRALGLILSALTEVNKAIVLIKHAPPWFAKGEGKRGKLETDLKELSQVLYAYHFAKTSGRAGRAQVSYSERALQDSDDSMTWENLLRLANKVLQGGGDSQHGINPQTTPQTGGNPLEALRNLEAGVVSQLTANKIISSAISLEDIISQLNLSLESLESITVTLDSVVGAGLSAISQSSSTNRVARYAVPPSKFVDVFGSSELATIAKMFARFREQHCAGEIVQLSDARRFLGEELQAAYDSLSVPENHALWNNVPSIVECINNGESLDTIRNSTQASGVTVNSALGWAILVEAALLNQRLNEDLQRVVHDPECECMINGSQFFYRPDPPEEARMAFVDYVRCRWPIHVFALDPQTQDQNVAEAFSMRRELQLVAALAFASGRMSASNTLRFARRLELEEQAIALNRTAIAFAHGANTFGWRFRPRFQTMDIESNAVTVGRDLLWGGPSRDARMKNWRIEPGMRECVALVVMPSFVPHVRFDVRSHWFKLHNHDNIKGEMTDTMKLSSKIAEAQQLMEFCHLEAENYRPGEIERLYARVKQLSDRLPLQTLFAQVPYENTAGGFELFSSGVTDLGPELTDFYGAPGIDPSVTSTLFLVGKNFSVHQTRLIAGNVEVPARNIELLSRDVMKVTIPPGVRTITCKRGALDGIAEPTISSTPASPAPIPASGSAARITRDMGEIVRVAGSEALDGPELFAAQEKVTDQPNTKVSALAAPFQSGVLVNGSVDSAPVSPSTVASHAPSCGNTAICLESISGCPQCTEMDTCSTCGPHGPVASDTYEAVELHLATPYGVSGRLLVPVVSQSPPVSVMPCNLTWFPSATAVEYYWKAVTKEGSPTTYAVTSIRPAGDSLVLHSPEGLRLQDQSNVDVVAEMQVLDPDMGSVGFDSFTLSEKRKLVATPNGYALEGAEFHKFHMNLSAAIHAKLADSKAPINFERVSQIRVKLHFSLASGNIAPVITAPLIVDIQLNELRGPE